MKLWYYNVIYIYIIFLYYSTKVTGNSVSQNTHYSSAHNQSEDDDDLNGFIKASPGYI